MLQNKLIIIFSTSYLLLSSFKLVAVFCNRIRKTRDKCTLALVHLCLVYMILVLFQQHFNLFGLVEVSSFEDLVSFFFFFLVVPSTWQPKTLGEFLCVHWKCKKILGNGELNPGPPRAATKSVTGGNSSH